MSKVENFIEQSCTFGQIFQRNTRMSKYNTFDFENETIQNIVKPFQAKQNILSAKELAIEIYLYVRDNWLYSPYRISFKPEEWSASYIAQQKSGHCIDKSILMISLLRAVGIPAELGLAKVKNHIAVEKIIDMLGSDVLVPHGYVAIFLEGKWVKATPAFNKELCEKINVKPLDFDGENDSIFQTYNESGTQFMEYLEDYGSFQEFPYEYIKELLFSHYDALGKMNIKDGMVLDMS